MERVSLESHLKELVEKDERYTPLLANWQINKIECTKLLSTVINRYPDYSMHDFSHSDKIIANIEKLLGDRINELSATDTWLLLTVSYTHDLGMAIEWSKICDDWKTQEFNQFLQKEKSGDDKELKEAVIWINSKDNIIKIPKFDWVFKTVYYFRIINEAYFRNKHAQYSANYIKSPFMGNEDYTDISIDLGHNGLIQDRLVKLVADIGVSHGKDINEILNLNQKTDGFISDYAHPRFVAMMLNLCDLLDTDNNRFNSYLELIAGKMPESSAVHKRAHKSVNHLLISPDKIEISCDCTDKESYKQVRNIIQWLTKEIDFFTIHWGDIVPDKFTGIAPLFKKKQILINGEEDLNGLVDLKLQITQKKAFQIIQGANIYDSKFIFVRELLQNALDTTKIQMWKDLREGIFDGLLDDDIITKLKDKPQSIQPFDIPESIYKSYPIKIEANTNHNGSINFTISDRGTGISLQRIKDMCNVGTSSTLLRSNELGIDTMPNWLKPTSGFGIGLQSIFLIAESFEIETNTVAEELKITFYSLNQNGIVNVEKLNKTMPRGSVINVSFDFNKDDNIDIDTIDIGVNRNINDIHNLIITMRKYVSYINMFKVDVFYNLTNLQISHSELESIFAYKFSLDKSKPFSDTFYDGKEYYYRFIGFNAIDTIKINQLKSEEPKSLKIANNDTLIEKDNLDEVYSNITNYSEIEIWDLETSTSAILKLKYHNDNFPRRNNFKDFPVFNTDIITKDNLEYSVNYYGLDTKENLKLSRYEFTDKGKQNIKNILDRLENFYISLLINKMNDKNNLNNFKLAIKAHLFDIELFWIRCTETQRLSIPLELLKISDSGVEFIKFDSDKKYQAFRMKFNDFVKNKYKYYYLDFNYIPDFSVDIDPETSYDAWISHIVSEIPDEYKNGAICIDENIVKACKKGYLNNYIAFKICSTDGNYEDDVYIHLFKISKDRDYISKNPQMIKQLVEGLTNEIDSLFIKEENSLQIRYGIPAIEKYKNIAVTKLPRGVTFPYSYKGDYIISPIRYEQRFLYREYNEESFINLIMKDDSFSKLVEYTRNYNVNKNVSADIIRVNYKKLIKEYYKIMAEK